MTNFLDKYRDLRKKYPNFTFERFNFTFISDNELLIEFEFHAENRYYFRPKMHLYLGKYAQYCENLSIEGIIFHIGLVELISYWKAFCSPHIIIKPYCLTTEQELWWKKLFYKGLGEFFYKNGIAPTQEGLLSFSSPTEVTCSTKLSYTNILPTERVIVPIGGGKDSVVTLETLRSQKEIIPFIINPRGATVDCVRTAGFSEKEDVITLQREISPQLLELNKQGFLNGHTPFSAMLAFYTLLVSNLTNTRDIALSNEASANEPTVPNTDINHQYSKSLEFEEDFSYYVKTFMNNTAHYYSYLRPFTELEIAEKFSAFSAYHSIFRSCNAGSKENKWCCACSKCLFAYLILSPFIADEKMIKIFGKDLLNDPAMLSFFDELTGTAPNKPFECVGTIDEVNKAVEMLQKTRPEKLLIRHYNNYEL